VETIYLVMLNLDLILKKLPLTWLYRRQRRVPDAEQWRRDPLSHPALSRMTPHELADLPFNRF